MKKLRYAFTMIELIFVIVVLGILSAVAFPKLSGVLEDANYASALATISSLRTAIVNERQSNLIKGDANYPPILDDASTSSHEKLFDGNDSISILQYPVYSKAEMGGWMKTTNNNGPTIGYEYYINDTTTVDFTYDNRTGVFDCNHSIPNCRAISE
ncbi:MAG: type II secretion system protein [Epsilonproteobacteria bacterium]|nr:type II secretion system protein [Campylobacterota bacterium]